MSRLISNYGKEIGLGLVILISTPININLLGVSAWSLYGLVSIFTLIIMRFDAGLAVLIQLEAAENSQKNDNGSLFNEVELIYLMLLPLLALTLVGIVTSFNFGSEALIFANEIDIAAYLILTSLVFFKSRIYESRLRGHSYEVVINALAISRAVFVAAMPFLHIVILKSDIASVFKSIFICELIILISLIFAQRILSPVFTDKVRTQWTQIRLNISTIKEAFSYQVVALVNQGFDIILAGILLPIEIFGIFVLMITVSNLVNSLLRPILLFGYQESYKSSSKISFEFTQRLVRLSFIFIVMLIFLLNILLSIWLGDAIPREAYPALILLLLGKTAFYGFAPLWAALNKSRNFTSRKNAYLISTFTFYPALLFGYFINNEVSIMMFCSAMCIRDLTICIYVAFDDGSFGFHKKQRKKFFYEFILNSGVILSLVMMFFFKPDWINIYALIILIAFLVRYSSEFLFFVELIRSQLWQTK